MILKSISLKNYRNYKEQYIDFSSSINFIIGENGQGKTNLLESIYMSSNFKSFRSNDRDTINFNDDNSIIKANFYSDYNFDIEVKLNRNLKKKILLNGNNVNKLSEIITKIPVIIFSPDDLNLIKGGPEERRKFLDTEISQISLNYLNSINKYNKFLEIRNNLLKKESIDENYLDIVDENLSLFGSKVIKLRQKAIDIMDKIVSDINGEITQGKETIGLVYEKSVLEKDIYDKLKENFDRDRLRGYTMYGPHRDDFKIYIKGKNIDVRKYGSQGQQRTAALALKLSEIELIKNAIDEEPILLLDDVLSELDIERQKFFVRNIYDLQIFLTSTEVPDELKKYVKDDNIFFIEDGCLKVKKGENE